MLSPKQRDMLKRNILKLNFNYPTWEWLQIHNQIASWFDGLSKADTESVFNDLRKQRKLKSPR